MAKLVRAISEMGGVVIAALDSTDIVNEMERIHKPSAVVSAALGRLLTASQLMGAGLSTDILKAGVICVWWFSFWTAATSQARMTTQCWII